MREGLIVEVAEEFDYNLSLGTTPDQLARTAQFTVGVGIGRGRVLCSRARFDDWAATVRVDVDPELLDREQLTWLDIGRTPLGGG